MPRKSQRNWYCYHAMMMMSNKATLNKVLLCLQQNLKFKLLTNAYYFREMKTFTNTNEIF